jgi:hypothetical protein
VSEVALKVVVGLNRLKKFKQEKGNKHMKQVNHLVQAVRENGTESIEYNKLFTIIYSETIVPKAESFELQLKGNVDEAINEGIDLFMELLEKWNGTGNFHSLFKTSYNNRLKNLVKYINREKRKHNYSYDLSLSESAPSETGDASPIIEVLNDKSLISEFDITETNSRLEELLESFRKIKPEQADLLDIMIQQPYDSKKSDFTKTICEYYGVQKYTDVIQKRVSRAREAFKKHLIKNNYIVAV